jgi:hypothetical protein
MMQRQVLEASELNESINIMQERVSIFFSFTPHAPEVVRYQSAEDSSTVSGDMFRGSCPIHKETPGYEVGYGFFDGINRQNLSC